jgi:hypothetical protein
MTQAVLLKLNESQNGLNVVASGSCVKEGSKKKYKPCASSDLYRPKQVPLARLELHF